MGAEEPGVLLAALLERAKLPPMCAVAVAMSVLDAVAALHQVGLWHGSLEAENVHVHADGTVRLGANRPAPAGQSDSQLRASDLQAVGVLLCSMLRLRLDQEPAGRNSRTTGRTEKPLQALARRMARGTRSKRLTIYAAVDARLALWEAAGRLATRRVQAQARQRLADLVAGPTESPAPDPQPPAAGRTESRAPRRLGRWVGAGAAAALVAGLVALSPPSGLRAALGYHGRVGATSSTVALAAPAAATVRDVAPPEPAPSTPVSKPAIPLLAPAAAGQVSSVGLRLLDPACQGGSSCLVQVEVWITPSPRPRSVAWTVESVQFCGGSVVQVGAGSFTAQPGWTHIESQSAVAVPAVGAQALLAVSSTPDRAASTPVVLGSAPGTC